jgi:hypothetical protein
LGLKAQLEGAVWGGDFCEFITVGTEFMIGATAFASPKFGRARRKFVLIVKLPALVPSFCPARWLNYPFAFYSIINHYYCLCFTKGFALPCFRRDFPSLCGSSFCHVLQEDPSHRCLAGECIKNSSLSFLVAFIAFVFFLLLLLSQGNEFFIDHPKLNNPKEVKLIPRYTVKR